MTSMAKKLIIIVSIVVVVLVLAIVGTVIENKEPNYDVEDPSEVVFTGEFNGKEFTITKKEIIEQILSSQPISSINEIIDKHLLKSFINAIASDDEKIDEKINYLIYNTTDEEAILKYQENTESNAKALKNYESSMNLLGYKTEAQRREYAKFLVAKDEYAKYRINNELKTGATEIKLDEETLKKEYSEVYSDVYAFVLRFYSQAEAKSVMNHFGLVTVSNTLRLYVGDEEYILKYDTNGYPVTVNGELQYITQTVNNQEVKVPNYEIEKDSDGNYIFDAETNDWKYVLNEDNEKKSLRVAIEDCTSFTSKNSIELSQEEIFNYYVEMYNYIYSQQKQELVAVPSYDDFMKIFNNDEEKLAKVLKEFGLVIVTLTGTEGTTKEIRVYVGDEEYVVDKSSSTNFPIAKYGTPVYKQTSTGLNIPNYQVEYEIDPETNQPVLDEDGDYKYIYDDKGGFIYVLENNEKIPLASKVSIDKATSFDYFNTIEPLDAKVYGVYISILECVEANATDLGITVDSLDAEYKAFVAEVKEDLLWNYDELSENRSALAKYIFASLAIDSTTILPYSTSAQLKVDSTSSTTQSADTSYYLVYKLTQPARSTEPTEEELEAVKQRLIKEYFEASNFVNASMVELRKEAGIKAYGPFLASDYESVVTGSGISSDEASKYFTSTKKENESILFETSSFELNDVTIEALTVTPDTLYDYVTSYSMPSYISGVAMSKIFRLMDEYTELHGTSTNYVASKNEKMKEYTNMASNLNYQYEMYKSYYGFDTLEEFLYSQYGAKNMDKVVDLFINNTMRNILIYDQLTGSLDENEFNSYALTIFDNAMLDEAYDNYFSVDCQHLLVYIDFNEDNSPDDWNEFIQAVTDGTTSLKNEDGSALTISDLNALLVELEIAIDNYIDNQESNFADSKQTIFTSLVKEFNESSRIDGAYKKFKQLGIYLQYQDLTSSASISYGTVDNYVKEFKEALIGTTENPDAGLVDRLYGNDLKIGYTESDGLVKTEFGLHKIAITKGSDFEKFSAKFSNASGKYPADAVNTSDKVSIKQLQFYVQKQIYINLYGSTEEDNVYGVEFPQYTTAVAQAVEMFYSTLIDKALDKSNGYHSNSIICGMLADMGSEYSESFEMMEKIYYDFAFDGIIQ